MRTARTRERSCKGKVRHRDHHAVRAALRESIREFGDLALVYYFCQFCKGFHVGHARGGDARQLKLERLLKLIESAKET